MLVVIIVVLGVFCTGKVIIWSASYCAVKRTKRVVYINEAWRRAKCVTLYDGVQPTAEQEQAMLSDIYEEIGIVHPLDEDNNECVSESADRRVTYV